MAKPKRRATEDERQRVRRMAGYGIPQDIICRVLGFTKRTFLREFREEMAVGAAALHERVANKLYQEAMKGNTACLIFYLKCRAGWRERSAVEVTGADGGPVQTAARVVILPALVEPPKDDPP